MMRYDLPNDRTDPTPPKLPPPVPRPGGAPPVGDEEPVTLWSRDRLFHVKPSPIKLLLVREAIDPTRTEEYTTNATLGLALTIHGTGAHVRFWGEAGLHDIRDPESPDPANPAVLVFVSPDEATSYRPPEGVVRKGLLKDQQMRREYRLDKGEMRDFTLERSWAGLRGHLADWLEPAVTANMRLRLLRLIVE
jgi:hypothetical protein